MMKAFNFLAKVYAKNWGAIPLSTEELHALEGAWIAGFKKAQDMAAALMTDLDPGHLGKGRATLIKAMGSAEVNSETGERIEY